MAHARRGANHDYLHLYTINCSCAERCCGSSVSRKGKICFLLGVGRLRIHAPTLQGRSLCARLVVQPLGWTCLDISINFDSYPVHIHSTHMLRPPKAPFWYTNPPRIRILLVHTAQRLVFELLTFQLGAGFLPKGPSP